MTKREKVTMDVKGLNFLGIGVVGGGGNLFNLLSCYLPRLLSRGKFQPYVFMLLINCCARDHKRAVASTTSCYSLPKKNWMGEFSCLFSEIQL